MKAPLCEKITCLMLLSVIAFTLSLFAGSAPRSKDATALPVVHTTDADTMRIEGERRFRSNCSRCHASPQKFPPRMMATVLRHMRVRATITQEDQKLILFYMTQ